MKTAVYIPSTGRAKKAAKTAACFFGAGPVFIVTREDWAEDYSTALSNSPARLIVLPKAYSCGIAQARNYILQHAYATGCDAFLMSDDDISLGVLGDDGHAHSVTKGRGTYACVAQLLLASVLSGENALSGARDRLHFEKPYKCQVPIRLVAVNSALAKRCKLNYAFCEPHTVMEDYFAALWLLRSGYPWRIHTAVVVGDNGSGASGGCSEFRTAAIQSRCAERLSALFPEWCKRYTKNSKLGEHYDVRFNLSALNEALLSAATRSNSNGGCEEQKIYSSLLTHF